MSNEPIIRLAALGESGANVYNMFHLLSQAASLYGRAAELDHRTQITKVWSNASDKVLEDIERMFDLWDTHKGIANNPADQTALGELIVKSCRRAERLVGKIDVWDPVSRWIKAIESIENRFCYILDKFIELDKTHQKEYETLITGSRSRRIEMKKLIQWLAIEAVEMSRGQGSMLKEVS
jgi:hypothetical protein